MFNTAHNVMTFSTENRKKKVKKKKNQSQKSGAQPSACAN